MVGVSVDFNLSKKMPVVIWTMRISDADPNILFDKLCEEEKARALRFRQPKDFERFVVAHSLKRFLLAKYLDLPSQNLVFDVSDFGKPFCRNPNSPYFSISHSGDWVVIGFSVLPDIGVDIEFYRDFDHCKMVNRVCSSVQQEQFESLGSTSEMFLCFWTQKEAIAKAYGQGISVGLDGIACSGHFGSEKVMFLQQSYCLWTYRWQNQGVLCLAVTMEGVIPECLVVSQFDGKELSSSQHQS